MFDIPRSKSGKRLRMRILRKFAKEGIPKLQDSVWDITEKRNIIASITNDFNELKTKIKSETKTEPKVFIVKGDIEEL